MKAKKNVKAADPSHHESQTTSGNVNPMQDDDQPKNGPEPTMTVAPQATREDQQALKERNLTFLESKLKGIRKLLGGLNKTAELQRSIDGDYNLYFKQTNTFLYKKGAKADTEQQIRAFARNPGRVAYGKPEKLFDQVDGKIAVKNDDPLYLTKRYDDVNSDIHAEEFVEKTGSYLENQGFTWDIRITDPKPYYCIVFGVGLGVHLKKLIEISKCKSLIIVENSLEIFLHSLEVTDWKDLYEYAEGLNCTIKLITEAEPQNLINKLNGTIQLETILGIDGLLYYMHTVNPILQLAQAEFASGRLGMLASFIGFTADEYNMMKNSFRNLKSGTKRMLNTARKHADLPVVIIGSGPSLEQNIDWIKRNREHVILISSGSSINALLQNGITPDIQCVLERAKAVYDRHAEAAAKHDLTKTRVVLTTTIWPGIDSFFKDVVYFLRPALSPLAVFMQDASEILNGEGPQVTNTAFAFAQRLKPKEIYMLGIDLGARDPSKPRAERAWISPGIKQRDLTIPVRGNLGRTVFTDKSLQHQKSTIENQLRNMKGTVVYNLSDGVYIKGAEPVKPESAVLDTKKYGNIDRDKHIEEIFSHFPIFTKERFQMNWEATGVRENIAEYMRATRAAFDAETSWSPRLLEKLDKINSYLNKPPKKQYAPRLLRGSSLRILIWLNSIYIRLKDRSLEEKFFLCAKEEFLKYCKQVEMEAYSLADELEEEADSGVRTEIR